MSYQLLVIIINTTTLKATVHKRFPRHEIYIFSAAPTRKQIYTFRPQKCNTTGTQGSRLAQTRVSLVQTTGNHNRKHRECKTSVDFNRGILNTLNTT